MRCKNQRRSTNKRARAAVTTTILGILAVSFTVLISMAGLVLVGRLTPLSVRQEHNNVAGFIYAVLGVAYGVALGFMLITVWQQYETARSTADQEANDLATIYSLANQLPESERRQVQQVVRSYAQTVIDEEWPMLQDGQLSPHAGKLLNEIQQDIENFEPNTYAEQVLYDREVSRVHNLADNRRLRLSEANAYIPTILWVVLLIGGVVTISFAYLFGLERTRAHMLMVGALSLVIASILFATYSLDNPFAGDTRLQPDTLESVLRGFEENQQ